MATAVLIALAKGFEGFHRVTVWKPIVLASPYLCPAGYWTQGWGHLVTGKDCPPIDATQGDAWLQDDLGEAARWVTKLVTVPLTQNQQDALIDWTFNLGSGRLRGSTMRARLNRGEYDAVPGEMRKWVYGGGVKLPGLIARREAEAALFRAG